MPRTPKGSKASSASDERSASRRRSPRGLTSVADASVAVPAAGPSSASKRTTDSEATTKDSKSRKKGACESPSSAAASVAAPMTRPSPSPEDSSAAAAVSDEQAAAGGNAATVGKSAGSGSGESYAASASGTDAAPNAGPAAPVAAAGGADDEAGAARTAAGDEAVKGERAEAEAKAAVDPSVEAPINSRREAWAQVARVRGAHFARPDKKPAPGTARATAVAGRGSSSGRVRVGSAAASEEADSGPKEHWPGPFAEARRLMDNREAAAALRESIRINGKAEAAANEVGDSGDERDGSPPPAKVEWQPKGNGSRTGKLAVPSLFRLCLNLLTDNFDHIESLGDVSPEVRNHLAAVMCRELKLTTEALQRLSEPGVTELILPDCSRIEPDQMRDSLLQCRQTLRVLRLGTCGRCVGDATVGAIAKAGGFPRLETASLAGTYQVTDPGVLELLSCCPRLTGLELAANSRITRKAVERMVDSERPIGMALTSLSLADCIQLGPHELEPLKGMFCLQRLSLSGLNKLTDATLLQILEACGWRLRHLDVSDCTGLTDASLTAVGERCGVLESFSLGMCPLFTSGAIQQLFQYSGSSVAASTGVRAQASCGAKVSDEHDDDDDEGGGGIGGEIAVGSSEGEGKGKGKGKGGMKGKGKGRAGANGAAGDPSSSGGFEEDDGGEGGTLPAGHAMLKSRLTSVSFRGLVHVDDKAVAAMAAACSGSLRTLDLKGLATLTDTSLVALVRYCSSSLESLDLSFCRATSDDGLGYLVDSSPNLRSLRLWGCTQVTDRFLRGHSRSELAISRY